MKMNSFFGILGLILLILPTSTHADELFIRFDESCMDQLEYVYQNPNLGNNNHLAYAIKVGQGRKIFLEVGEPIQRTVPQQTINCSNAFFDEQMVDAINLKIDQVFVITVKGNRYFAAPVTMAAFSDQIGNNILYNSPKYGFRFNLAEGAGGVNVGYGVAGARVTFEGRLDNACSGSLAFRQIKNSSDFNDIISDVVYMPEIGVIEERIGYDVDDAIRNAKKLVKVNGKNLDRYTRDLCSGTPLSSIAPPTTTTPYYQPQVIPQQPQQPIEDYNYGGATYVQPKGFQETSTVPIAAQYHTVKKGETLYSISKKYSISISDIRDWNGLQDSNLIFKGDRLQVSSGANSTPANTSTTIPAEFGSIQPQPATDFTQKSPAVNTDNSNQYHTVRFGETVASIALKYGLTEQKLRAINGLNTNEFARVNQKLKVSDCNCPPTQAEGVTAFNQINTNTNYPTYPQPYNSTGPVLSPKSVTPTQFNQELRNTPQFYRSESPYNTNTNSQQIAPIPPDYNSNRINTLPRNNPQTSSRNVNPFGNETETAIPVFPAPNDDVVPQSYEFVPNYNTRPAGPRKTHVVKDGEDLYKISQMYDTNVQRLLELNNMRQSEVLIPYQRIYVQ